MEGSRAVLRCVERVKETDSRGAGLLRSLLQTAERIALINSNIELGLPLPGRFNDTQRYPDLNDLLLKRLMAIAEKVIEQIRICLEEFEVGVKQMTKLSQGHEGDELVVHSFGQEFWRKRQLLEGLLVTDSVSDIQSLIQVWPLTCKHSFVSFAAE